MTASARPEDAAGLAGWWNRLGRGQRALVAVVGLVVVVNVLLAFLSGLVDNDPGGPISSSFSTGREGLEGWSDLLAREGRTVDRDRQELAGRAIDPRATLVVADPRHLSAGDARSLGRFVARGGRLVATGPGSASLVAALVGSRVGTTEAGGTARTWVPAAEVRGVRHVVGGHRGWTGGATMLPVAGTADGTPTVLLAELGQGRVVAVADTAVFQNRNLDRADNAALALAVVGPRTRPVAFVESLHGYSKQSGGLEAVPSSWKWALAGLALAFVLGAWSAGARLGGPEPDRRALRPPRQDHVDAVAADLDRVVRSDAEVVGPLVDATRAALAASVGAPPDASAAVLWAAGEAAGVDPGDLAVLTHPVQDLDHALQVGAIAAARQRAQHGLAPSPAPDTVPTDPATGGPSS